jgi:hypothetical protein
MFKNAVKAGIALKILTVVRREAAKPENQARIRHFMDNVTSRASAHGDRSAHRSRSRRHSS